MKFKRILLKISGELLGGEEGRGAEAAVLKRLTGELGELVKKGFQLAIVVGGGNFWRYKDNANLSIPRTSSDMLGMMASVMNARLLSDALIAEGIQSHALSAHGNFAFAEPFESKRGRELLERGSIVVCGGGTGNPYFTTDSAAVLRALELGCDALFKATKVDGVYDSDPKKNPGAKRFEQLTSQEAWEKKLEIMDLTAMTLSHENGMPILVFDFQIPGNLLKIAQGDLSLATLITS